MHLKYLFYEVVQLNTRYDAFMYCIQATQRNTNHDERMLSNFRQMFGNQELSILYYRLSLHELLETISLLQILWGQNTFQNLNNPYEGIIILFL